MNDDTKTCPIVGIGASAGGLEAVTVLLNHLPIDTGFGFVLVQHLDPQHESALTHLLARATALPVTEIKQNLPVEPNHVYVIPPNASLRIQRGILTLQPRPATRTPHHPIDFFLESLAEDCQDRAIGVILSGTATDGTLGLEAIKGQGGITFAQDGSARYDSMPRSAIASGSVDFVLSPEAIAKEITRIARHPYVRPRLRYSPILSTKNRNPGLRHGGDEQLQRRNMHRVTRQLVRSREWMGSGTFSSSFAIIPEWIFRSTNPQPYNGGSRGAWW